MKNHLMIPEIIKESCQNLVVKKSFSITYYIHLGTIKNFILYINKLIIL